MGMWLSSDPALGEDIPRAPLTKEDKEANGKLPGNGGIYNPVKYTDPKDKADAEDFFIVWANGKVSSSGILNFMLGKAGNELQQGFSGIPAQVDKGIVGRLSFVSEYGAKISLIAYATGNVEVGVVIDGVTLGADITLAVKEYSKTDDKAKFAASVSKSVGLATIGAISSKALAKSLACDIETTGKDLGRFIEQTTSLATAIEGIYLDTVVRSLTE